jgi:hypothetical protein
MIYEFTAGTEYWYIDTSEKYVKVVEKITEKVIKENHNLGLLGQLEGRRIATYEGTYAMIGVSPVIKHDHYFLEGSGNRIIWMEDTPK